ncbi:MAG TPA: energy transducer TonB [Blastocatellia bacterium]|nr:energy transducer TonB [Blastocatellia bacterium]
MKHRLFLTILILAMALLIGLQIVITASSRSAAIESPAVVAAIVPPYPIIARTAHVGGEVTVEESINSNGEVVSAKASGHQLLAGAAERAAKQWRFAPAKDAYGNRTATLIFAFQIMPRCAPVTDLTPIFYPPYKVEVRGEKPPITCDDCSPAEQERLRCKNP